MKKSQVNVVSSSADPGAHQRYIITPAQPDPPIIDTGEDMLLPQSQRQVEALAIVTTDSGNDKKAKSKSDKRFRYAVLPQEVALIVNQLDHHSSGTISLNELDEAVKFWNLTQDRKQDRALWWKDSNLPDPVVRALKYWDPPEPVDEDDPDPPHPDETRKGYVTLRDLKEAAEAVDEVARKRLQTVRWCMIFVIVIVLHFAVSLAASSQALTKFWVADSGAFMAGDQQISAAMSDEVLDAATLLTDPNNYLARVESVWMTNSNGAERMTVLDASAHQLTDQDVIFRFDLGDGSIAVSEFGHVICMKDAAYDCHQPRAQNTILGIGISNRIVSNVPETLVSDELPDCVRLCLQAVAAYQGGSVMRCNLESSFCFFTVMQCIRTPVREACPERQAIHHLATTTAARGDFASGKSEIVYPGSEVIAGHVPFVIQLMDGIGGPTRGNPEDDVYIFVSSPDQIRVECTQDSNSGTWRGVVPLTKVGRHSYDVYVNSQIIGSKVGSVTVFPAANHWPSAALNDDTFDITRVITTRQLSFLLRDQYLNNLELDDDAFAKAVGGASVLIRDQFDASSVFRVPVLLKSGVLASDSVHANLPEHLPVGSYHLHLVHGDIVTNEVHSTPMATFSVGPTAAQYFFMEPAGPFFIEPILCQQTVEETSIIIGQKSY